MVTLPNSQKVKVTHSSFVCLLTDLTLQNVLYIPSFRLNLVSVHKLCRQFQKCLIFTPNSCLMLQGPSMKSPLVIGKEQEGLYILNSSQPAVFKKSPSSTSFPVSVANVFTSCSSFFYSNVKEKLWHYRLGHTPLSNMKKIIPIPIFCSKLSSTCCPMARQSK